MKLYLSLLLGFLLTGTLNFKSDFLYKQKQSFYLQDLSMDFTDEDVSKLNNLIDERFKLVELRLYNQ